MDAAGIDAYPPANGRTLRVARSWRDVSLAEFEAFLRDYPRPLQARPPLNRKANCREWLDPALGNWPGKCPGDVEVASVTKSEH
jgi:hypothetical protein